MPAAYPYTGNDVLHNCPIVFDMENATVEQKLGGVQCLGYVSGLNDASRLLSGFWNTEFYCIPEKGLEAGQVVRVFLKWLVEHPTKLHESARSIFITAMRDSYPCDQTR